MAVLWESRVYSQTVVSFCKKDSVDLVLIGSELLCFAALKQSVAAQFVTAYAEVVCFGCFLYEFGMSKDFDG